MCTDTDKREKCLKRVTYFSSVYSFSRDQAGELDKLACVCGLEFRSKMLVRKPLSLTRLVPEIELFGPCLTMMLTELFLQLHIYVG